MSDDLDNAREGSPNKGNSRQLAHSSAMSALNENVSDIFKLPAGVMQVSDDTKLPDSSDQFEFSLIPKGHWSPSVNS